MTNFALTPRPPLPPVSPSPPAPTLSQRAQRERGVIMGQAVEDGQQIVGRWERSDRRGHVGQTNDSLTVDDEEALFHRVLEHLSELDHGWPEAEALAGLDALGLGLRSQKLGGVDMAEAIQPVHPPALIAEIWEFQLASAQILS